MPLGEESEAYEIDILDSESVKRTIATTTPSAVYTAAQQAADLFPGAFGVVVYQISETEGRGTGRMAKL